MLWFWCIVYNLSLPTDCVRRKLSSRQCTWTRYLLITNVTIDNIGYLWYLGWYQCYHKHCGTRCIVCKLSLHTDCAPGMPSLCLGPTATTSSPTLVQLFDSLFIINPLATFSELMFFCWRKSMMFIIPGESHPCQEPRQCRKDSHKATIICITNAAMI